MTKNLKVKHIGKDEQTRILCRKLKRTTGEEKKRVQEELITLHCGLINKLSHKYGSGTFCAEDIQDAKSEALLSILSLFESFDTEGPTAFSTYAYVSLSGVMKNWKKKNLLIPISNNFDHQWVAANKGNDTCVNPRTGKEEEVNPFIKAMVKGVHSLDYPTDDNSAISSDSLISNRDDINKVLDDSSLEKALQSLTEQEAAIVEKYYIEDKSYKQIAKEFGCTHQYIGQKMNRARTKLLRYYQKQA